MTGNKNLLFMHGGAPTAVINASLFGAYREAKKNRKVGRILAAEGGTGGLLKRNVIDLTDASESDIELLTTTPGSAIGTGRDHLEPEDYFKLRDILLELEVGYVLMTGGNGTMDTCRKLADVCEGAGICVCGIPKTMDNDLSITDHSPGYGSAARYIAGSVKEAAQDVKGLAIHVVVIEAFGRDAGWITAASSLAREAEGDAPDMILLPEVPFDEERFLLRVKELYERKGGVVVVASEGLRYADGTAIVEPIFQVGRSVYFGDVSSHLANLVIRRLGIKARSEKPGILGRASEMWASDTDREEAIACGAEAVKAVLSGRNGQMSIIRRISTEPYMTSIETVEIVDEILEARVMPERYIDRDNFDVTQAFRDWARPLIAPGLGRYVSFIGKK
jgi:6-phosphofructokinase 1